MGMTKILREREREKEKGEKKEERERERKRGGMEKEGNMFAFAYL